MTKWGVEIQIKSLANPIITVAMIIKVYAQCIMSLAIRFRDEAVWFKSLMDLIESEADQMMVVATDIKVVAVVIKTMANRIKVVAECIKSVARAI